MMNYKEDMRIDESALDVECLDQAELAMKYAAYYADIKTEVAQKEEEIKVCRSELIDEVNSDPVKCCGKEKPNAADIEAYYRTDPEHKRLKQEFIALSKELIYAEHAKNEIGFTRKAMLEALITLHGQQYFAGPKMPRDLSFEAKTRHDRQNTNRAVGRTLKRKKT
jgi:hypothetical protein